MQRASLLGQVHDLTQATVVVEFNHLAALEAALMQGDVACVLTEPAMTNIGMVLPDPGYWEAAQSLIRRHGAALVMDAAPRCGVAWRGVERDLFVAGQFLRLSCK